jgi:hypothetical protein
LSANGSGIAAGGRVVAAVDIIVQAGLGVIVLAGEPEVVDETGGKPGRVGVGLDQAEGVGVVPVPSHLVVGAGDDPDEAEEWIRAKAKGLDMSEKARMARALEQGYITSLEKLVQEDLDEQGRPGLARTGQQGKNDQGAYGAGKNGSTPQRLYHGTLDKGIRAFVVGHPNRKDAGWLGEGMYLGDFGVTDSEELDGRKE